MPHDNIIDHIFAGSPPLKKQKKRKTIISQSKPVEPKSPAPEVVHDPSSQPRSSKRHSSHATKRTAPSSKKRKLVDKHDEDSFNDSRGTGPRRKTEEGFSIYKEAELGINVEAGGTPLCPFDCKCCF
jgi:Mg-chelatase subunit ChlI